MEQEIICENCGSSNLEIYIIGHDDKHDEVYYGTECEDCGVKYE